MRSVSLTSMIAVALALAACGGDEPATTTTTTRAPTTTSQPTTTTVPTTTSTTTTVPDQVATAFVAALQQQLQVLGFFNGDIDGIYGPVTIEAVMAFQRDAGITVDGEYGPETEDALVAALEADADFVKELQESLGQLGLYTGPVDGDYGPGTKRAVTTLQEQCDLEPEPDGRFTPLTHVCLEQALADDV